jgi:hypothetical protein
MASRARATVTFVTSSLFVPGVRQITGVNGVNGVTSSFSFPAGRAPEDSVLSKIARDTGGEMIPVDAQTNLGSTFRKILDDFRSSYVLFYSPKGVERTGFHTITVNVSRPAGAIVTARRGYFGG